MFRYILLVLCACAVFGRDGAEQLGYPPGTKALIIHADDLAVAHAVDRASFAALEQRAATAASIMVPCPWLTEVAAWWKDHSGADLGLHLTLTAEWKNYRWGPLAPDVPGLLDPNGYLWPEVAPVTEHASPEEVEREIRAQIERALKVGLRPTHLDSHMGTLFVPKYFATYVKVAREYKIPFFAPRVPNAPEAMRRLLQDTDIEPDALTPMPDNVMPEDWMAHYRKVIKSLKPGLTEMIVHLGYDNEELRAITEDHPAYGSAWRQHDFDTITSDDFKHLLESEHVKLVGWKEIRDRMYPAK
ncbi:MAG TPA: polysaccharide deacetylase family protein [Bryobacteraceae bacterium]|nr:polysaccharide deacetylase family protein [Bryobacteraceae bacterium]